MNLLKKLYVNYKDQNTPELAHRIGNWLLSIGALGVAILGFPVTLDATLDQFGLNPMHIILPALVITVCHFMIACGVFGKIITKLFSKNETTTPTGDIHPN